MNKFTDEIPTVELPVTEPISKPHSQAMDLAKYCGQQALQILRYPEESFEAMPRTGGYYDPALFLGLWSAAFAILEGIGHFNPLVSLLMFVNVIGKTICGALAADFAIRKLTGNSNRETVFRVYAYSKATLMFAWISVGSLHIGGFVALVYSAWLNYVGLSKTTELDSKQLAILVASLAAIGFAVSIII